MDIPPEKIAGYFKDACMRELAALKPGNVHVFAPGHRMQVADFEAAATAAAPHISNPELKVGARIHAAVEASVTATGCNTNLGIVLLCAPLAHAAANVAADTGPDSPSKNLRRRLAHTLKNLDINDATRGYDAIALANPAGLGAAPTQDVNNAPTITLRDAMTLARDKDRIANAYATDFSDIFDFGLPVFRTATQKCIEENIDPAFAVTTLHMNYMARFPDSHIARKHGHEIAATVQSEATAISNLWQPVATPHTFDALMEFDTSLKRRQLNPGTTADFVVATIFADYLD